MDDPEFHLVNLILAQAPGSGWPTVRSLLHVYAPVRYGLGSPPFASGSASVANIYCKRGLGLDDYLSLIRAFASATHVTHGCSFTSCTTFM